MCLPGVPLSSPNPPTTSTNSLPPLDSSLTVSVTPNNEALNRKRSKKRRREEEMEKNIKNKTQPPNKQPKILGVPSRSWCSRFHGKLRLIRVETLKKRMSFLI